VNLFIAKNYLDKAVPMNPLTVNQQENAAQVTVCNICENALNKISPISERNINKHKNAIAYYERLENIEKVKFHTQELQKTLDFLEDNTAPVYDHDHLTGEFRGVAHSICNLNYKVPRFIPIFFHNLSGYDAHLFIKQLGSDDSDIKLIANTEEKYISFSKLLRYDSGKVDLEGKPIFKTIEMRFLDSFRFMASSLDTLAKNLEKDQFQEVIKHFPADRLDLLTKN
jgi:hypothetical protein